MKHLTLNVNVSFYRGEVNVRVTWGTLVVWLQNAAGAARWTPTEDRVDQLLGRALIYC